MVGYLSLEILLCHDRLNDRWIRVELGGSLACLTRATLNRPQSSRFMATRLDEIRPEIGVVRTGRDFQREIGTSADEVGLIPGAPSPNHQIVKDIRKTVKRVSEHFYCISVHSYVRH